MDCVCPRVYLAGVFQPQWFSSMSLEGVVLMKRILMAAMVIVLAASLGAGLVSAKPTTYRTHLSGDEEVPPRDTHATGQANFWLNSDGTELTFMLIVANIENVVASHIHIGAPGVNGGVVAFLYPTMPPGGGPINGIIATGTITDDSLIGTLAGQPLSALIDAIEAGNAYVNVHTNDGIAPIDTGPGDFPGGEVRGQID